MKTSISEFVALFYDAVRVIRVQDVQGFGIVHQIEHDVPPVPARLLHAEFGDVPASVCVGDVVKVDLAVSGGNEDVVRVVVDPACWLVAGSTQFKVLDKCCVKVLLVPLVAGSISYPRVEADGVDVVQRERGCAVLVVPRRESKVFTVFEKENNM